MPKPCAVAAYTEPKAGRARAVPAIAAARADRTEPDPVAALAAAVPRAAQGETAEAAAFARFGADELAPGVLLVGAVRRIRAPERRRQRARVHRRQHADETESLRLFDRGFTRQHVLARPRDG